MTQSLPNDVITPTNSYSMNLGEILKVTGTTGTGEVQHGGVQSVITIENAISGVQVGFGVGFRRMLRERPIPYARLILHMPQVNTKWRR